MPTNKSALQAVLFDLDGTLLDTAGDFAVALNQLRKIQGQPPLDYKTIRATVSNGSKALISLAFGIDEDDKNFEPLRQQLLDLYLQGLAIKTKPFDGISELLEWLDQRAIPWGIVTNKPSLYTHPLLNSIGLATRCAVVVCSDDVSHSKPHPESLQLACSQLQCDAGSVIYIGDHRRDIEAGHNADMRTVAATYGYIEKHDPPQSWGADFSVDHPRELIPLLLRQL